MMNTFKRPSFAVVVLGLLVGFAPQSVVASGGLRTVALTGQQVGGLELGGYMGPFSSVNRSGHVAFRSELLGSEVDSTNNLALWLDSGAGLELVAREGDSAAGATGAVFRNLFPIKINSVAGEAVFASSLTGEGVTATNDRGIWRRDADGVHSLIAREGDAAPGTEPSVTFKYVSLAELDDDGSAVFSGWLDGPGISVSNDRGIWRQQRGEIPILVGRTGNSAPGVPTGVFSGYLNSLGVNDNGQLTFGSTLTGSGIDQSNDSGVWSDRGDNGLALIAREGAPAQVAGAGVLFEQIYGSHAINNAGQLVFKAALSGDGVGVKFEHGEFLAESDGQLSLVARTSDPAPGVDDAFFSRVNLVDLNDLGETVISGGLTGDDIDSTNGWGIWSDAGSSGLELIARRGDEAPGTEPGTVFRHFDAPQPRLNNQSRLAFMAFAGPSWEPGQPNPGGGYGLWAQDPTGELQLILQQWDMLDVSDDPSEIDLRTVSNLRLIANKTVLAEGSIEPEGTLAFWAAFTDGSQGIFLSDLSPIPIPGDFDLDRDTDGADFLSWQRGESPVPLDAAELALWQQAFGLGQNLPPATSEAVPEPSGLLLLGLGGLLLSCQRGRKDL